MFSVFSFYLAASKKRTHNPIDAQNLDDDNDDLCRRPKSNKTAAVCKMVHNGYQPQRRTVFCGRTIHVS
jgi:hypothetical protein